MTQGNVKAQRKRRKAMMKSVARAPNDYILIDGNYSFYPYGYCKRKNAYLTMGLANTHHCQKRNCEQFERIIKYENYRD